MTITVDARRKYSTKVNLDVGSAVRVFWQCRAMKRFALVLLKTKQNKTP